MEMSFYDIINKYALGDYLAYFIKNNKGNLNPYHNLYHMQCVVENVSILTSGSGLDEEDVRKLLIAAIFHDFNHTTNKDTESNNIEDAIQGLQECCTALGEEFHASYVNLIQSTSYPYINEAFDLSYSEQILRDADMLQCFDKNYIQQVAIGLSNEWKMDMVKSLDVQYNYVSNVEFCTPIGREQAVKHRVNTLRMLNMLKEKLS
jgi:hypothetical protein